MESWKAIPGYIGIYEASDLGRIRTTPGKTTSNALYPVRVWKTRVLKPKAPIKAKRHDQRVTLWKDGAPKDYLVARLVASAWHGEPSQGMTVNHINGDHLDNRPSNLEWVSLSDNVKLGFKTGLFDSIKIPVTLRCESGSNLQFSSMSEADRFLGRRVGYLSCAAGRGRTRVSSSDGKRYYIVSCQKREEFQCRTG